MAASTAPWVRHWADGCCLSAAGLVHEKCVQPAGRPPDPARDQRRRFAGSRGERAQERRMAPHAGQPAQIRRQPLSGLPARQLPVGAEPASERRRAPACRPPGTRSSLPPSLATRRSRRCCGPTWRSGNGRSEPSSAASVPNLPRRNCAGSLPTTRSSASRLSGFSSIQVYAARAMEAAAATRGQWTFAQRESSSSPACSCSGPCRVDRAGFLLFLPAFYFALRPKWALYYAIYVAAALLVTGIWALF